MPPRRKKKKKEEEAGGSGGQAALLPGRPAPSLASGRLPPSAALPTMMFSGVGCFWVLLSSCLVAVCSLGFLSPAWIVRPRGGGGRRWGSPAPASVEAVGGVGEVSFGLLWHCSEAAAAALHVEPCDGLGGLGGFGRIPSASWQVRPGLRGVGGWLRGEGSRRWAGWLGGVCPAVWARRRGSPPSPEDP